MVRSKIFDECVYLETKQINERDETIDIQLYMIKLLNCKDVYITVGGPNKKYRKTCLKPIDRAAMSGDYADSENTIIYHLVYLMDNVDNEMVVCRIGVYEILETKYNGFLDEEGDLILNNLSPLLFKFVTDDFLIKNNYACTVPVLTMDDIKEQLVAEQKILEQPLDTEIDDDIRIEPVAETLIEIYPNQTLEQYNEEYTKAYLSKPLEGDEDALQWVRAYLLNKHFKIKDKGGAGDCLFCVLASAINDYSINNKGNGVPVFSTQDVASLREIISNNITDDDFENYITIYKDLNNQKLRLTREIKKNIEEHKRITDNFKQSANEARRKELVIENKAIKKTVKTLEAELIDVKQMLNEFKYMKSLRSLRDFRSYVTTSNYWGDEMAIGILQKHFNFKAIILSQETFVRNIQNVPLPLTDGYVKNMKNVIQCGSSSLGGIESPYFYIVLNYTGNHYQLVSYRNKESFTFNELPFTLKIAIVKECMKLGLEAGYGKLEQFVDFRDKHIELMF